MTVQSLIARWMPVLALVGWGGMFVHNLANLPGQTILSPESAIPLLVTAALIVLWWTPWRTAAAWGLLGWGTLHVLGAILTVLPLAVLPFEPEQSLKHYGFHLLYLVAQLPLVVAAAIWLRRPRLPRRSADSSPA